MIHTIIAKWRQLTPWWFLYAVIIAIELVLLITYFGPSEESDTVYLAIRLMAFIAIGIAAIDQAKHRAFYLQKSSSRARGQLATSNGVRTRIGIIVVGLSLASILVSALMLANHAPSGAGTFLVLGIILGVVAAIILHVRPPGWL